MNEEEDDSIVDIFVSVIDSLIEKHKLGILYYENDLFWEEKNYYSNMAFYSPHARSKILRGERFEVTPFDDLYLALMRTYVQVTGYTPPPWFHKNQTWLLILQRKLQGKDEEKQALLSLLYKCTSFSAQYVLMDAGGILQM